MVTLARGWYKETLPVGLLLLAVAFILYLPILGNFFTWDDFLWVYRARTLRSDPLQVFSIDAVYFDPLVYLSFWLDCQLHGLDYFWYHVTDVGLHACNGILLYRLALAIGRDRLAAIASALIFVASFAVVDAVSWSSSRVDLLAVFFSLLTLIFWQRHLQGRGGALAISAGCYLLALASKGTPLLLPAVLAIMLVAAGEHRQRLRSLWPHLLISFLYLAALLIRLAASGKPLLASEKMALNGHNLLLSFAELFIPEGRLAITMTGWLAVLLLAIIVALSLWRCGRELAVLRGLGLSLMAVGLLPVLILKDFKTTTTLLDAGYLLSSPSHRIYLASAGAALLIGSLLAMVARKTQRRWIGCLVLLALVGYGAYENRIRQQLWSGSADYIRKSVEGIATYRQQLLDDCVMLLVNFPMSRGFMRPALAVYGGLERVLFLPMGEIPEDMLDAAEIFRYRNRGFLFVYGNDGVRNLSPAFNKLLDIAFYYQVNRDQAQRARLMEAYRDLAADINVDIAVARQ